MTVDYTRADKLNELWTLIEKKLKRMYPAEYTWGDFALQHYKEGRHLLYQGKPICEQSLHLRVEASKKVDELFKAVEASVVAYRQDIEDAITRLEGLLNDPA